MKMQNKDIAQITELAALFLPPDRIARIIEIDAEVFKSELMNEKSDIYRAYYIGYDHAEVEIRESVIKLARQGSQPAQDHVKKYISELKAKLDE